MTKFKLIGAVLVVSAMPLMPVSAQVSEPAAAAAQDPNFSIYSSGPGFSALGAMAQTLPDDQWAPRTPARPHRVHHLMKRY